MIRTALVTGASSGIGAALARALDARGTEVVLAARREGALQEVAAGLSRARVQVLDVSRPDEAAAIVRRIDEEVGGLDLIVANAGVAGLTWAGELDWETCAPMIDVNVRGAIATLTAVLPRMVERRRGHLVGVSSMAAYRGLPHNAIYSATKACLSTFLEGLRVDLGPTGVRVTDVRPGFVETPMTAGADHGKPFEMPAHEAAARIVRAIDRDAAVAAFPWQTAALVRSLTLLPARAYDFVGRLARPPRQPR
ncbi:MAG: SDR family NAD(P)-dependent oxidoreductase [Myxococcota bacterium]|nr:SDR family NAD(P)-dependent oxidoreductase [Myxococcota bacterium]